MLRSPLAAPAFSALFEVGSNATVYNFSRMSMPGTVVDSATTSLGMNFDTSGVLRFAPHNLVKRSGEPVNGAAWTLASQHTQSDVVVSLWDGTTGTTNRFTRGSGGSAATDSKTVVGNLPSTIYAGQKFGYSFKVKFETFTSGCRMSVRAASGLTTNPSRWQINQTDGVIDDVVAAGDFVNNGDCDFVALENDWVLAWGYFTAEADIVDPQVGFTMGTGSSNGETLLIDEFQFGFWDPDQTIPRTYNATGASAYFGPRKSVVYNGTNWEDKGLLVEGESANSLTYSRDFSNAAWLHTAEASVSSGVSVVDGATRNIVLTDDSGAARLNKYINTSCPNDSNVNLFSIRVPKTSGASHFPMMQALLTGGTAQQMVAILDTDTGVVTAITETGTVTSQAEDFDDHWLWWSTVLNNSTGNTTARMLLNPAGSTNGTTLDNAATGSTAMDYATIELNTSTPTSPIETVASAVTRTVDDVTRATTSLPGTILLKGRTAPSIGSTDQVVAQWDDGTEDNRVTVLRRGSSTQGEIAVQVVDGGASQADFDSGATIADDTDFAIALRISASDFAASLDGASVATDGAGTLPSGITTFRAGDNVANTKTWGGSLAVVGEWTAALSDDALARLSS